MNGMGFITECLRGCVLWCKNAFYTCIFFFELAWHGKLLVDCLMFYGSQV